MSNREKYNYNEYLHKVWEFGIIEIVEGGDGGGGVLSVNKS